MADVLKTIARICLTISSRRSSTVYPFRNFRIQLGRAFRIGNVVGRYPIVLNNGLTACPWSSFVHDGVRGVMD